MVPKANIFLLDEIGIFDLLGLLMVYLYGLSHCQ